MKLTFVLLLDNKIEESTNFNKNLIIYLFMQISKAVIGKHHKILDLRMKDFVAPPFFVGENKKLMDNKYFKTSKG